MFLVLFNARFLAGHFISNRPVGLDLSLGSHTIPPGVAANQLLKALR